MYGRWIEQGAESAPAASPTLKYQKQKRSESISNTTKFQRPNQALCPRSRLRFQAWHSMPAPALEAMKPEVNRFAQAQSLLQQADGYSDAIHDKSWEKAASQVVSTARLDGASKNCAWNFFFPNHPRNESSKFNRKKWSLKVRLSTCFWGENAQ